MQAAHFLAPTARRSRAASVRRKAHCAVVCSFHEQVCDQLAIACPAEEIARAAFYPPALAVGKVIAQEYLRVCR